MDRSSGFLLRKAYGGQVGAAREDDDEDENEDPPVLQPLGWLAESWLGASQEFGRRCPPSSDFGAAVFALHFVPSKDWCTHQELNLKPSDP